MPYNSAEKLAAKRLKEKRRYYRRQYWIGKIKTHYGCSECGYKAHQTALDFDHLDPSDKLNVIPKMLMNCKLTRIFAEIRKCRIICSNCHRVHTHSQWSQGLIKRKSRKKYDVPFQPKPDFQI